MSRMPSKRRRLRNGCAPGDGAPVTVKGDVAKRADVEAMIDTAWKELGGSTFSSTMRASKQLFRSSSSRTISGRGWWMSICAAVVVLAGLVAGEAGLPGRERQRS